MIINSYRFGALSTLLNGLVSYWKLDDLSGLALDSLGLNDGTVVGATQGAAGKIGTSYSFDGVDDYINIDNVINDLASTTSGTWSAWVKPVDATPAGSEIFINFGDTNRNENLQLYITSNGKLNGFYRIAGVSQWFLLTSASAFSDNTWTHIAIIHNGTAPVLYVNAVAVAQTFSITTDKTSWFNNQSGLDNGRIGDRNYINGGETQHFNGSIDEVGIWDRDLTASEITELYNAGAGKTYPF